MTPYYSRAGLTLYLGDCRDVLPTLAAGSFAAVVTDPPYGLGMGRDGWDGDVAFMPETWRPIVAAIEDGGWAAAFSATRQYHRIAVAMEDAGLTIKDAVAWLHDGGMPPSRHSLLPTWEPAVLACRGKGRIGVEAGRVECDEPRKLTVYKDTANRQTGSYRTMAASGTTVGLTTNPRWPSNAAYDGSESVRTSIKHWAGRFFAAKKARWEKPRVNGHPTVKPVALMEWLVKLTCPEGGAALDPFAGSGTTLIACHNLGRTCVGIEQHEPYAEIAARRLDAALDARPLLNEGA